MAYPYRKLIKPRLGSRPYKGHRLSKDLIGLWLMNEGTGGKCFDLSGNGNTGALQGDTHFVPGKFGSALNFDGTGDYVDCGTSNSLSMANSSAFTISAWVKLDAKSSDRPIVTRGMPAVIYFLWWDFGDDLWEFFVKDSEYHVNYAKMDSSPTIGQWYHIVGVWDGSNIYVYEDAVQGNTSSAISATADESGDNTHIGRREELNTYFNGLIDHVMIFNRALSASEIALLYRCPFCMFKDPAEIALLGGYQAAAPSGIPILRRRRECA